MNLLSPPTDSFYKFLAVGGLLLFLTCGILEFKLDDNYDELFAKQKVEERVLRKEVNMLIDEFQFNLKYKKLNDSINNGIGKLLDGLENSKPTTTKDSIIKDSLDNVIIYNLPDSIQIKIKNLLLKNEQLASNRDLIENSKSTHDSNFIYYMVGITIGEIMAAFGFIFWYLKIQKPLDDEYDYKETQKHLQREYFAEKCQSCFKTFLFMDERGTEKDGSTSKLFCNECYKQGSFIEPTLTIDEASLRLKNKLIELKYKKRKINENLKKLPTALRWKRIKLW